MTVRINKPPVNLRSKLSELERPIGLKGGELMASETAQEARELVSAGRKNLLINGDLRINQRGLQGVGGTTNLSTGTTYLLDRWFWNQSSGSTFRAAVTTDVPSGSPFKNSLRLTLMAVGSLSSTTFHFLRQKIEGFDAEQLRWGTSQAKSITLSFWVKSSIAATNHCVYVGYQGVGIYPVLYSINSANTWEYKTITIPGATSGTWGTGESGSVEVEFDFGTGATYSTTNNTWTYGGNYFSGTGTTTFAAGPANSTWYVTGVQLEVGKNATEFEHRSYGEELALCQRYYQQLKATYGVASTTTALNCLAQLLHEMRGVPTLGKTSGSFNFGDMISASFSSSSSPVIDSIYLNNNQCVLFSIAGFTGLTAERIYRHEPVTAFPAVLTLSAEL